MRLLKALLKTRQGSRHGSHCSEIRKNFRCSRGTNQGTPLSCHTVCQHGRRTSGGKMGPGEAHPPGDQEPCRGAECAKTVPSVLWCGSSVVCMTLCPRRDLESRGPGREGTLSKRAAAWKTRATRAQGHSGLARAGPLLTGVHAHRQVGPRMEEGGGGSK